MIKHADDKKKKKDIKVKQVKKVKKIKDLDINKKKRKTGNNSFSFRELIIIVIITCLLSCTITGSVMYLKSRASNAITKYKLSDDKDLSKFVEMYSDIVKNYYEEVDREKVINSAINGMLSELGDTYTKYMSGEQSSELMEQLEGEYKGIGIQIVGNTVYSVFKNSPAEKAGLKEGDIITNINGNDIDEDNYIEITDTIKNGEIDTFDIKVLRDEKEMSFSVKRETIDVPSVSSTVVEDSDIGYIYIKNFSSTTSKQFKNALYELESKEIKSLIIDLRGNNGGYLSSAFEIANLFIEKGKIIYSLEDKDSKTDYKDNSGERRDYKIVILVNGGTASSSEVLTAALKDSYEGTTIVGTKSFGKGKVQTTKDLNNGNMAKYTTSKWLRPNGECVDGVGITPDYEIQLKLNEDNTAVIDTQLDKAIELLKEK